MSVFLSVKRHEGRQRCTAGAYSQPTHTRSVVSRSRTSRLLIEPAARVLGRRRRRSPSISFSALSTDVRACVRAKRFLFLSSNGTSSVRGRFPQVSHAERLSAFPGFRWLLVFVYQTFDPFSPRAQSFHSHCLGVRFWLNFLFIYFIYLF